MDAYHNLTIREDDRTWLAFRCLGRLFKPVTMLFGLATACLTWTKVMRPVVQYLREQDLRIREYLDDFGGAAPAAPGKPTTKAQAVAAYEMVEKRFGALFLTLHPNKGVKDVLTRVRLLGNLVDTRLARFLLPDDRVYKIVAQASSLSRNATEHRLWMSFRPLRKFCGPTVSTALSAPAACYHLRSLLISMQYRHGASGDVCLGSQAWKDLMWWTDLQSHAAMGRPI